MSVGLNSSYQQLPGALSTEGSHGKPSGANTTHTVTGADISKFGLFAANPSGGAAGAEAAQQPSLMQEMASAMAALMQNVKPQSIAATQDNRLGDATSKENNKGTAVVKSRAKEQAKADAKAEAKPERGDVQEGNRSDEVEEKESEQSTKSVDAKVQNSNVQQKSVRDRRDPLIAFRDEFIAARLNALLDAKANGVSEERSPRQESSTQGRQGSEGQAVAELQARGAITGVYEGGQGDGGEANDDEYGIYFDPVTNGVSALEARMFAPVEDAA